jgi:N-carbamoylputrescine amidase
VAVVAPIFERVGQLDYFSTALVFDSDGRLVGRYRKAHIPELPDYQEKFYFQPGDQGFPVFATRYAAIGVQISWDNFFPEGMRVLGLGGAELVFSPTSASVVASHQKWERAMVGAAVYNGFYVFRVNRVKGEDHLPFYGKSFCVDPNGDFVVEPSGPQEGVILAEVEPSSVKIARDDWPFLKDRRPELYKALS